MRLIELYILRRISLLFFTVFMAAISLTWIVQILARINFLTTSGQTFLTIFRFTSLFIPSAIPLVMPFALVLAVAQTLSTMNQDSELVVISTAGSPRSAVWRPVLVLGIFLSLCSFVIANFVTPHSRLNMRQMMATAHTDLINMFLQEGSFRNLDNGIYLEIGERRANGSIGRLFIVDQSDPKLDLFYYAVDGMIASNQNGNFLIMRNGEVQRRDNKTGNVSIIRFDSYTFDLSEFAPASRDITIYPKDRFLTYLLAPDPDDSYYQRHPRQYTAELHRRLTEWLYPFIFALIALAVAGDARSHREAHVSATFSAVVFSVLTYWLGYFFADRAENDLAYVPLLYIMNLGVSGLLVFMLLTNRRLGLPVRWSDAIYRFFDTWRKKSRQDNRHTGETG